MWQLRNESLVLCPVSHTLEGIRLALTTIGCVYGVTGTVSVIILTRQLSSTLIQVSTNVPSQTMRLGAPDLLRLLTVISFARSNWTYFYYAHPAVKIGDSESGYTKTTETLGSAGRAELCRHSRVPTKQPAAVFGRTAVSLLERKGIEG